MDFRARKTSFLPRRGAWRVAGVALSMAAAVHATAAPRAPDCSRPLTLGLHEHGLLYSSRTGEGIDKDIADQMARRSGCRLVQTMLPRARIWQLIESGALDFTLTGITNPGRERFAEFAWYEANKYYLLARRDTGSRDVPAFLGDAALRVGLIRSFRYDDRANAFVDRLEEEGRVTYAGSLDPLYTLLMDGGIQAMIVEPFDFPAVAQVQLKAGTLLLDFGDPPVRHGLVMSRKSLPPEQRAAWQGVIAAMRADGTLRRIFEKYLPVDLARQMTQF